ncbi:MAG TPA: zf-HC2 domain-containing protein [Thermoanaerobaculia bacterium]|nr:zf-HC2 domain-containing protein [Thermoanaerobaculia bacterium]
MHATPEILEQLRARRLPPAEVLAVTRHLATCRECAELAASRVDAVRAARAVEAQLAGEPHPEAEILFRLVAGTLDTRARTAVEEHLAGCTSCREDFHDLRSAAASVQPHRWNRWWLFLAAAAALAIVVGATLWLRPPADQERRPPAQREIRVRTAPLPPRAPSYGNAEWDALVSAARARGGIEPPPFLAEIAGGRERLRGTPPAPRADALQPAGVVVASDRPRFTWPPREGARYVVSVYAGVEKIAESGALDRPHWTPRAPLPRGVTIAWQVEVRGAGEPSLLPVPPDPPALFRIAEAERLRELDEAGRRFPDDHLLLALLYARAGMQREAAGQLRIHVAAHPEARPLLESIERWDTAR